jgi:3-phenylpropionate/trans-cinnamate dioxygenase ferredoxin component
MFKAVAKVSELSEDKVLVVSLKYIQLGIIKKNDEILAFEDICSHDGESISSGKIEGNCIICPRHFAKFDLKTGSALCMPATEPISIFPVRIVGENIEVDLEEL